MVISKCSNLVSRKRQVQTRFNVFLSPFVAYKAVQFLSVYTMSDLHRQLSSYFMVEYHESLIMFRRIWSPLHLNQQRLSHCWIVVYFALHQNTWTISTVKIATDLACAKRRYPCNTSGFRRQWYSSPQGTHSPIYVNLLWFSVYFAKLRRSGPVWNFFAPPTSPSATLASFPYLCLTTLCLCKISLPIT